MIQHEIQKLVKLHIHVCPNAKHSAVIGWQSHAIRGRILRLKIAAPPIDGAANQEVIALLARELRCPKSRLSLDQGGSSREKTIVLPDDMVLPAHWS